MGRPGRPPGRGRPHGPAGAGRPRAPAPNHARGTGRRGRIPDVAGDSEVSRQGKAARPGRSAGLSGRASPAYESRWPSACRPARADRPVLAGQTAGRLGGPAHQPCPGVTDRPGRGPGTQDTGTQVTGTQDSSTRDRSTRDRSNGGQHSAGARTGQRQARTGHQARRGPEGGGHQPPGPGGQLGPPGRAAGEGEQHGARPAQPDPQYRARLRRKQPATQDVSRRPSYPLALLPGMQQEL